jgi:hypothetical protein
MHLQEPLGWWNSTRGKQARRREQLWRPSFGREKKCLRGKTEAGLALGRNLKFRVEVQSMALSDVPSLRKRKKSVSGNRRYVLLCESSAIPDGLRLGYAEEATSGEPNFQRG